MNGIYLLIKGQEANQNQLTWRVFTGGVGEMKGELSKDRKGFQRYLRRSFAQIQGLTGVVRVGAPIRAALLTPSGA